MTGEVLRRGSPDYFLSNPPKQPKKEIGDYVESQGILVPRRFSSLAEAISSCKPFIARSEHPQDYTGVSGLLQSPKFEPRDVTQGEIEDSLRDQSWKIDSYCRFAGISKQEFLDGISYSYWEFLPGYNRTVIADSAIPGRYHVIATLSEDNDSFGYTVVENGTVKVDLSSKLPSDLAKSIPPLIQLYESVRNLERFDSNHCPIVEAQSVDGKEYFLQYHRGTNSNYSSFTLNREPEDGEIEATFVRGATPMEGVTLKLSHHTVGYGKLEVRNEDAGLDWTSPMFRQIMVRKRQLHIVEFNYVDGFFSITLSGKVDPHLTISELFKSPISLAIAKKTAKKSLLREFYGSDEKPVNEFYIHVVSDGRRAYIKRLD